MATKQRLTKDQRNSFIAAQLGWTMDAFDYGAGEPSGELDGHRLTLRHNRNCA